MRIVFLALATLVFILQYKLWFEDRGVFSVYDLKKTIDAERSVNMEWRKRNNILIARIDDLKHGQEALEEHARHQLSMVRKGELYYQVVSSK